MGKKWEPPIEKRNRYEPWWNLGKPEPKPEPHDCEVCGYHAEEPREEKSVFGEKLYLCVACFERNKESLFPPRDEKEHPRTNIDSRFSALYGPTEQEDRVRSA